MFWKSLQKKGKSYFSTPSTKRKWLFPGYKFFHFWSGRMAMQKEKSLETEKGKKGKERDEKEGKMGIKRKEKS